MTLSLCSAAVLVCTAAGPGQPPGLPTGVAADYQLGGAYPPPADVGIVVRDRRDPPVAGSYSICYINAFQTQPGARSWWLRTHPDLVLRRNGRPVMDRDWGEMLLDTRTPALRRELAGITRRWIDGCAQSGFDAVEPDNLDSWTRSRGTAKRRHNLAFARILVRQAHAAGLAIGQKNAAGLSRRHLFDFAVTEQCQRYAECHRYTRVYGNQVLEIEYRRDDFRAACRARADRLPIVWRDPDLVPRGQPGYRYAAC